jgi:hypothetical protein
LFRATVDALELEGIRLLADSEVVPKPEVVEETERGGRKRPLSLRELFSNESSPDGAK